VNPARRYDLLIFDWDGTLMDSVSTIVECTRATLDELGLPQLPEALIRGSVGLSVEETVRRLTPGGEPDAETARRILETYRRNWFDTFRQRPLLFPGVVELLAALQAAGYLLAVATGKSRRGLSRDLEACGMAAAFHATRTADEARSKPDPQMLHDLLDELGARPRRALMVGDSIWDLQMATAAAMPAVAVATGAHPRPDLLAENPLACFDALSELAAWLRRRAGRLA
jgi:phosphoglycolate phosphatase